MTLRTDNARPETLTMRGRRLTTRGTSFAQTLRLIRADFERMDRERAGRPAIAERIAARKAAEIPSDALSASERAELRETGRGQQLIERLNAGENVRAEIDAFLAARRELLG
jgi:hypothetical protein